MRRSYDDYPQDQANKLGLPLDHPTLLYGLELTEDPVEKPFVDAGLHRITISSHRKWITDRWDDFQWEGNWYHLPFCIVERAYSLDEICKLNWNSVISDEFYYNPVYRVIGKLMNALHHWCHGKRAYNHLPFWYNLLHQFSFGSSDDGAPAEFEVRFDYATYHNEFGYSKYTRTFLDGPLAYLVYYKGEHVLTISFAPSVYGVLLTQIQLKKQRGNRWLYKLPCHYVEYVVRQMAAVFQDTPLYIADGESLANRIRQSYVPAKRDQFTDDKFRHVVSVYDREFDQFERTGEQTEVKHTVFHRLKDLTNPSSLEWFCDSMKYRPHREYASV